MLVSLHVRNLALIEETEVFFQPGLNILTGETGAGKSVILGSVALALGAKADRDMIRTGAEYALIELTFEGSEEVREALRRMDLPAEDNQIILQRRVMPNRSICRINGETVPIRQMRELAGLLIDIHGQHDNQILLQTKRHLEILDAYAEKELPHVKEAYAACWREHSAILQEIAENELDEQTRKREISLAEFERDEIEEANFVETPNSTTLVLKSTTKNDDNNNNKDENSNKTKNSNNTAWIIAIPSILTGAAIVLAIVGVALRKVKFKKPVKKTKNAYDRNSKQSQQIYMRKATMLREERLRELQQQLETLQNERATYETQYKKDLSSLRQLKIKRAPASEIAKLEKDMKQNQKHSAQIGSSIRSVELEIDFTNSNEYIKQVVKKLSSAKQDEQEQDNQ